VTVPVDDGAVRGERARRRHLAGQVRVVRVDAGVEHRHAYTAAVQSPCPRVRGADLPGAAVQRRGRGGVQPHVPNATGQALRAAVHCGRGRTGRRVGGQCVPQVREVVLVGGDRAGGEAGQLAAHRDAGQGGRGASLPVVLDDERKPTGGRVVVLLGDQQ